MYEIAKKPYEKFPIKVNFSVDLDTLETISTYTITCINTLTGANTLSTIVNTSSVANPDVKVTVQAGTAGEVHKITVKATTNLGNIYEDEIWLEIADSIDGEFTKEPSESFIIASDFGNAGTILNDGDTLSTQTTTAVRKSDGVTVTTDIIFDSDTEGNKVLIGVTGGVDNASYLITCRGVTANDYHYQLDFLMVVEEL